MKSTHLTIFIALFAIKIGVYADGRTPEQSLAQMELAEGFQVDLIASEPLVRQPVVIEFDDRGRLWVIQYLQYPNPAGLKRVQVDRYSRTQYDRVPEPPPQGPRGADRISILKDTDGDGRADSSHDFIDGLNLATGIALGHDGVFVLNVPYLLFYPDKDRDDIPDSDPEVLLTGFGMEDAHSVANSLTWGPDGWLYGCQGSTVTANIRGIEFQQGVWRYHPVSKEFELYCEGGGNCWGLDFDAHGNLFYSTNYGGYLFVHGLPGAYYVKSFAKHGDLHNRFSYGFFNHAPHKNFRGGHVTVGGMIYQGHSFPESFRGKYIAADLLGHGVYWHDISRQASSFVSAHGGELMVSKDRWFAPTDLTIGPDGAVYVADWCDPRTAHPDPDADWDRSNGRIYRISAKGTPFPQPKDIARSSEKRLVHQLRHEPLTHQWQVRHARQELVRRHQNGELNEVAVRELRKQLVEQDSEQLMLQSLWTLASLGTLDEASLLELFESPHAAVRAWAVRLLGERKQLSQTAAQDLYVLAETELALNVRVELACAAQRFPPHIAMPIINANIIRDIDSDDQWMPLLWWWAVEKHCIDGHDEVVRRFVRSSLWKSRLGSQFLLPKLIRRYAASGSDEDFASIFQLIAASPMQHRESLWKAVTQGLGERKAPVESIHNLDFRNLVIQSWQSSPESLPLLTLAILLDEQKAFEAAEQVAFAQETPEERRISLFKILATTRNPDLLGKALEVAKSKETEALRLAALGFCSHYANPGLYRDLIDLHLATDSIAIQSTIRDILLSRQLSAIAWVSAVDAGEVPAASTPLDQIRRVAIFNDDSINKMVIKHWGKLQVATPEEKLAEVRRLNNDVRAGPGDVENGKRLFTKHCATCHKLFGEGSQIGPDLTTANRQDRSFLLVSLVDPSSVIRKEYMSVIAHTHDGRILTGLLTEQNDASLKLVNTKLQTTTLQLSEIEEMNTSSVSLMPEDLYRQFRPQDLRDLLAYLQRKEP